MELALIPVAALLLLLTSLGTPAHATALGSTAADLLRVVFSAAEDGETNTTPDEACPKPGHNGSDTAPRPKLLDQQVCTARRQPPRPQTLDKRASRFASASVAYRTTAPPATC